MRTVATILALLLSVAPLKAQWSGSVDGMGGFGATKSLRAQFWEDEDKYLTHFLGQGKVSVNYDRPRFHWGSSLEGRYESKLTDNFHLTAAERGENGEDFEARTIVKMNTEKPLAFRFANEATFRPSPAGSWSFWLNYDFRLQNSENLTYTASFESDSEDVTQETPLSLEQILSTGFRTAYELGSPRRVLLAAADLVYTGKDQETQWIMIGGQLGEQDDDAEVWFRSFKMTPSSYIASYSGNVHFRDSLLTGPTRLVLDPGMWFSVSHAEHQNSGATLDLERSDADHMEWIDSTAVRESFRFVSIDLQPRLAAGFEWKKLRARADYALSFYARQLTDSTHQQGFKWQSPYPVGNGSVAWQLSPKHSIFFYHSLSVKHPTYLQVCWFDRSGGYIEQLYRGSESLRATRNRAYRLEYGFRYERFLASASASLTYRRDEIEQTWFNEMIDNRTYKVFSWLNGADSRIVGSVVRLGWRGTVLTANMGVESNHTTRVLRETGESKDSDDWRVTADAAAHLRHGWTLSGNVLYQSKVSTFFSVFKEHCFLNARIQKDFRKVSLYLEGRDLLDQPVEAEFISADEREVWFESTLHNRRLILLGANWKF